MVSFHLYIYKTETFDFLLISPELATSLLLFGENTLLVPKVYRLSAFGH